MTSTIRIWTLAAGAAALLSGEAVSAAPSQMPPVADPLVSLSLLGTAQSRAAVCTAGATCTMAAAPTTTFSALAGTAASVAAVQNPDQRQIRPDWPGIIALFAVPIAIILAIALQGGGRRPVSPG
jgi:hypothetical protein